MIHYHVHLSALRWNVSARDGWRQRTQRKRLTWRGLFGGWGTAGDA